MIDLSTSLARCRETKVRGAQDAHNWLRRRVVVLRFAPNSIAGFETRERTAGMNLNRLTERSQEALREARARRPAPATRESMSSTDARIARAG
jgi:hypothetical protein